MDYGSARQVLRELREQGTWEQIEEILTIAAKAAERQTEIARELAEAEAVVASRMVTIESQLRALQRKHETAMARAADEQDQALKVADQIRADGEALRDRLAGEIATAKSQREAAKASLVQAEEEHRARLGVLAAEERAATQQLQAVKEQIRVIRERIAV